MIWACSVGEKKHIILYLMIHTVTSAEIWCISDSCWVPHMKVTQIKTEKIRFNVICAVHTFMKRTDLSRIWAKKSGFFPPAASGVAEKLGINLNIRRTNMHRFLVSESQNGAQIEHSSKNNGERHLPVTRPKQKEIDIHLDSLPYKFILEFAQKEQRT